MTGGDRGRQVPRAGWLAWRGNQGRRAGRGPRLAGMMRRRPEPAARSSGAPGGGTALPGGTAARVTFGEVFAVAEFRALWLAQVLSVGGDQLARVALPVLVFSRTHSAMLAAVTFAASIVPTSGGGLGRGGLADRFPRRAVMITCDLVRAVLVAAMAVPGMPLAALVCLLAAVTMAGAPFTSARAALYPDILAGDRYVLGSAVTLTTFQLAQAAGFAAGGAAVAVAGTTTALLVDAATFVASALLVTLAVKARPAARAARLRGPGLAGMAAGVRLVFADPGLRLPMLLGWLAAFYDIPEGIAAPLARAMGGGAAWVGFILAAGALGASAGAIVFSRLVPPPWRLALMAPLAVATCAALVPFAAHPGLAGALAILAACGLLACYQVAANAAFVTAAPASYRAQAFGVAQGGMSLAQGAAMVIAGALAQRFAPAGVIAAAGATGAVAAAVLAASHRRGLRHAGMVAGVGPVSPSSSSSA
jgi:predicted MFS family arabinose efflux permease